MNHSPIVSKDSSTKTFSFIPQPAPAWTAILALIVFTGLGILAGAGSVIRLAFPLGSFVVGVFLYQKYPILYIGFTWWLWFLSPLIRRLVDYQSGWTDPNPILLAPSLVTLVTLATVGKYLPKAYRLGALPFILALAGVFYSFLIGIIKTSPLSATRDLLGWLTPIAFGFHLLVYWRYYPSYRQNIQRTFLWGVLVMGAYGVIQFLFAPEWDCFWLIESGMTSSAGKPEPLGIRVWSTMNSPGPFAGAMTTGLLLLFSTKGALRIPAAGFGYLSFLLTIARSAWGAWFVGYIIFTSSLKSHLQIRLIITALLIILTIIPLASLEPFSERIGERFATFSNLEEDNSAQERQNFYRDNLNDALSNYLGTGIGGNYEMGDNGQIKRLSIDSGIIALFFTLGWFGAIPYLGGIFLLLWDFMQYKEFYADTFMGVTRAIFFTTLLLLIISNTLTGFSGLVFWAFSGMTMAGHKYHSRRFE